MTNNLIQELVELFMGFPGIGPRQARRFVEYLVRQSPERVNKLTRALEALGRDTRHCEQCGRWFVLNGQTGSAAGLSLCSICRDPNRETGTLLVVEKEVDLDNIERSGDHHGHYFVLTMPAPIIKADMVKNSPALNRLLQVIERDAKETGLKEVVLAFPATEESQYLTTILKEFLRPIIEEYKLRLSTLGRGLATGLELEYSDAETLHHALKNRQSL